MKHPPLPHTWLATFAAIGDELVAERIRQQAKFGEQSCPDAIPQQLAAIYRADVARRLCQAHFASGRGTWIDILCEEVAEAADEAFYGNTKQLRQELVQVAAVAVAWIEAIDRR
jgi:hypothetical protein